MKDELRQTGRTTKMLLNVVKDIFDDKHTRIFVLTFNHHHARELHRRVISILSAFCSGSDIIANKHDFTIRFHDTVIFFVSDPNNAMRKGFRMLDRNHALYIDHAFYEFRGKNGSFLPDIQKAPKKKTIWQKIVDKFKEYF